MAVVLIAAGFVGWYFLSRPSSNLSEPIKIGIIVPLTGTTAFTGDNTVHAAQIAVEEINANGGVLGRPLQLIVRDEGDDASTTLTQYDRMVSVDGIFALVGIHRSGDALALQEPISTCKTIFIGVGPASVTFTQRVQDNYDKYKYSFRINQNTTVQPLVVSDFIVQELMPKYHVKTWAFIVETAAWAQESATTIEAELKKAGMTLSYRANTDLAANDFSVELTNAKDADVIVPLMSTSAAVVMIKQWYDMGIEAPTIGCVAPFYTTEGISAAGGKANYTITNCMAARAPITNKTVAFYDKYMDRFRYTPTHMAFHAYDGIYVLAEAITKAGRLDTDAVIKEMENIQYEGVSGRIVFTSNHDVMYGTNFIPGLLIQWMGTNYTVIWPPSMKTGEYVPPKR